MTHVIRTPLGLLDLRALAAWNARQRRTREEYAAVPSIVRNVHGPCIRGCGAQAHTQRGVCRACLRKEAR